VACNVYQARNGGCRGVRVGGSGGVRGMAAQIHPIKPKLKAPGTERLKLKCDEPPSNLAFKFNLRRFTEALIDAGKIIDSVTSIVDEVGRCRLTD